MVSATYAGACRRMCRKYGVPVRLNKHSQREDLAGYDTDEDFSFHGTPIRAPTPGPVDLSVLNLGQMETDLSDSEEDRALAGALQGLSLSRKTKKGVSTVVAAPSTETGTEIGSYRPAPWGKGRKGTEPRSSRHPVTTLVLPCCPSIRSDLRTPAWRRSLPGRLPLTR